MDLKVGMSLQGNIKLRKVSYLQLLFTNFKDKTKSIQELQDVNASETDKGFLQYNQSTDKWETATVIDGGTFS